MLSTADLRSRATRGGGFSAVAVTLAKSVAIIQLAVVARLLQPQDFGVFTLGMVFLAGVTTLTTLGIETLLVQRVEMSTHFVRSAWTVSLIRGSAISFLAYLSAPFYAAHVNEPLIASVLQVLALAPLFTALSSPNQFIAQRELRFRSIATFQVTMSLLQLAVVVVLAHQLRNVYALAVGHVVVASLRAPVSWVWFGLPGWPGYHLDHFKELFSVGRHFLVIAIGTFVMTQVDNLFVGTLLGATTLGLYALAYKASQFAIDILYAAIGRIILPVFSRLQLEQERLISAFKEIWRLQIALLLPLIAIIALLADDLVLVLYGAKYAEAASLLQILALLTLGRGLSNLLAPFIVGTGGVAFASRIKIFETSLFIITVWFGTSLYGAPGAAWGAGTAYVLSATARLLYVKVRAELTAAWLLKSVAGTVSAVAIALTACLVLNFQADPVLGLIVVSSTFLTCYLTSSLVLQKDLIPMLRKTFRSLRTS